MSTVFFHFSSKKVSIAMGVRKIISPTKPKRVNVSRTGISPGGIYPPCIKLLIIYDVPYSAKIF